MATEKIFFAVEVDTGTSATKIEKLRANFKGLAAEIKATERSQKRGTITAAEANKKLAALDKQLIKARTSYNKANKAAIEAEKSVSKGARAFLKTEKAAKKANTELKKTQTVSSSLTSTFKKVGAAALAAFAARAVIAGIKDAINIIKNFEQSSANLAAVLGKSVDQMQALQNSAKELGATTSFTASQVVELQTELAKLGFTEKEILNATEATLNLAEAAGAELGQAAKVAGNTLRGLGLDAKDMGKLVDVMAKSFSSTALDITKFEESMKLVAPTAKATGVDLETVTAQLGVLANNGISGSIAGTQLNRVFIELNKKGLSLQEALDKVTSSQNKLGAATDLVGDRGAKALLIFSENQDKLGELKTSFENAGGAAKRMAETQLNTLEGRTKLLSSAWEGFVLSLDSGEGLISNLVNGVLSLSTNILGAVTSQEKLSDQLVQTNAELNAEFDLLKNGNLTVEQRSTLIEEINSKYGGPDGYLENLITEASTLEEIEAAQRGANKALKDKILLTATQERLTELTKEAVEAEKASFDIQERIANIRSGAEDVRVVGSRGGAQTQEQANEAEISRLEGQLNRVFELRDEAAQRVLDFQKRNANLLLGEESSFFGSLFGIIHDGLEEEGQIKEDAGDKELIATEERAAKKLQKEKEAREKAAQSALKTEQDAQDKLDTFLLSEDEKEIQALNKKFEELFSLNVANNEQELELELKHQEALTLLIAEQEQKRADNKKKSQDEENAKAKQARQEELQIEFDKRDLLLSGASKGLSDIQNLTNVFTDNKLRELDRASKEELSKINEREEQGFLTRDQAEQKRRKLELDSDTKRKALEKKEFQRNKAFQIAQIGVNLAAQLSAIQLAAALNPTNAVTFGASGITQAAVQSGIAIGSAALNVAAVAAQKFQKGGVIEGASHANGGVPIMGGRAEVEGGEIILTRGVAQNPSLFAAANEINMAAGGASLGNTNYAQEGGILSQNLPTFALPETGGQDDLIAAISNIVINSQVSVSEINSAQNNVAVVEQQAAL